MVFPNTNISNARVHKAGLCCEMPFEIYLNKPHQAQGHCFPIEVDGLSLQRTDIQWALAGIDLLMNPTNLTINSAADLERAINPRQIIAGVDRPTGHRNVRNYQFADTISRTAMGLQTLPNGAQRIILAVFFGENMLVPPNIAENGRMFYRSTGANWWDVREIMRTHFNCTEAIMLDGGRSSQISYRDSANGTANFAYAALTGTRPQDYAMRDVPVTIRVNAIS